MHLCYLFSSTSIYIITTYQCIQMLTHQLPISTHHISLLEDLVSEPRCSKLLWACEDTTAGFYGLLTCWGPRPLEILIWLRALQLQAWSTESLLSSFSSLLLGQTFVIYPCPCMSYNGPTAQSNIKKESHREKLTVRIHSIGISVQSYLCLNCVSNVKRGTV